MIMYNPAFDLYHSIFRMAHIASKLDGDESLEIDKVRIWDFYLLFPDKVHTITIRRENCGNTVVLTCVQRTTHTSLRERIANSLSGSSRYKYQR